VAEEKLYTIRKEGQGTFGLGEEVAPNCYLFRAGNYGLTKEEVDRKIAVSKPKQVETA